MEQRQEEVNTMSRSGPQHDRLGFRLMVLGVVFAGSLMACTGDSALQKKRVVKGEKTARPAPPSRPTERTPKQHNFTKNSFSVQHPSTASVLEGDKCINFMVPRNLCSQREGEMLKCYFLPALPLPNYFHTFNGAGLAVNHRKQLKTENACIDFRGFGSKEEPATVKKTIINGVAFLGISADGSGLGNHYEDQLFRTFHEGRCIELCTSMHWRGYSRQGALGRHLVQYHKRWRRMVNSLAQSFKFRRTTAPQVPAARPARP